MAAGISKYVILQASAPPARPAAGPQQADSFADGLARELMPLQT